MKKNEQDLTDNQPPICKVIRERVSAMDLDKGDTLTQIADELRISLRTIQQYAKDILKGMINRTGTIKNEDRQIEYANMRKLPAIFGCSPSCIKKTLAGKNIPIIKRYYKEKHHGKISMLPIIPFYHIPTILERFPKLRKGYKIQCRPADDILRRCPKDLNRKYYYIYCIFLMMKNTTGNWPSYNEIYLATKGEYSLSIISEAMRALIKKGFICRQTNGIAYQGLRKSYLILNGPRELLTIKKKVIITDPRNIEDFFVTVPRDYCHDNCQLF